MDEDKEDVELSHVSGVIVPITSVGEPRRTGRRGQNNRCPLPRLSVKHKEPSRQPCLAVGGSER